MRVDDADVSLPLVSVAMATYNDAVYLPTSVESVLNQKYPFIECILIDDGSTDQTPDLVKRWSGEARFRYIRIGHGGLSVARNEGVKHARGEFVAFLDADDWWEPDKTMQQVRFLLSNPDMEFCWCDYKEVGREFKVQEPLILESQDSLFLARRILLHGVPAGPPSWMVRTTLWRRLGGYDTDVYHGGDREFMFRMACNAKGKPIGKTLTTVRRRRDSMGGNIELKVPNAPKVLEKMLRYRPEIFPGYRTPAMHNLHRYLISYTWMNQAWHLCIRETLRAAYWNPSYVLSSEFWRNFLTACMFRLIRGRAIQGKPKIFDWQESQGSGENAT
jgi:glycosyltransferase involved in cell wall biosynthesis